MDHLAAIRTAATQSHTTPVQAAVTAARAAGVAWREIAGALGSSSSAAAKKYGPNARAHLVRSRERYQTRRTVLPGLSVETAARAAGVSSHTLYRRFAALPAGHPATVRVLWGKRTVTRVLDAAALNPEKR